MSAPDRDPRTSTVDGAEILARVEDAFGTAEHPPPMTRTTADGSRAVGMLRVDDCPDPGITSWATLEASAFETPLHLRDGRDLRVEFVAAVDARLDLFGNAVAACAFAIGPENAVRPGTVYRGAVSRQYPEASTPHLFSTTPFAWKGEFAPYDDDAVHVTWLQVVPITDAEADLVAAEGARALEVVFEREQPDLYSINRADTLA